VQDFAVKERAVHRPRKSRPTEWAEGFRRLTIELRVVSGSVLSTEGVAQEPAPSNNGAQWQAFTHRPQRGFAHRYPLAVVEVDIGVPPALTSFRKPANCLRSSDDGHSPGLVLSPTEDVRLPKEALFGFNGEAGYRF
jgi:hypothetical protein